MDAGSDVISERRTRAAFVHVELEPTVQKLMHPVRPSDVGAALDALGWLGAYATVTARQALVGFERHHYDDEHGRLFEFEPDLLNAHIGSPLTVVLGIDHTLLLDAASLALFGFGLRVIWRLDLQLRTDRLKAKAAYYDALRDADESRKRFEAHVKENQARAEEQLDREDQERGWSPGATRAIERRRERARSFNWHAGGASLNDFE